MTQMNEAVLIFLLGCLITFFFSVLLEAALMWCASRMLKFGRRDFGLAFKASWAHNATSALIMLVSVFPFFLLRTAGFGRTAGMPPVVAIVLFFLSGLLTLAALMFFLKRYYGEDRKKTLLAFNIIVTGELMLFMLLFLAVRWPFGWRRW